MEKEAVRKQEQQRVDKVIAEIAHRESKLQSRSAKLKESVIDLRKNFWEDVTVNLDEPDDVIETQASIKQQAELLSERERSHGSIAAERNKLRRLKDSPYFARIDFKEAHEKEPEAIYIGTASLLDREEEDILIYDWRAPISSLYYDYALGEASYQTMEGSISGNISLKRQFIIRQGNIRGMFDTGITIGDRLLQEALGNNASATMKSIVATIQKEQNKIIRNEKSDLLVVQGVAGSGKTSAVLQRIAYLLYRHRQELNEKNMLLFSPNPLFSSYIANVLPELGEANISQATFLTFLKTRIGNKYTIETPFEQMEYALAAKESKDEAQTIRMSGMAFKSSLSFKKLIDAFAARLKDGGIFFRNIKLRGRLLISKEEISDYFYQLDAVIAIPNKMEMVAKWLVQKLRALQKEELHKDWVLDEMELMDKEDFLQAYYQNQAIDADDFSLEEKILRKEVVKRAFRPLIRQVKRFAFVHIGKTYQQLFLANAPLFGESVSGDLLPENWSSICRQTIKNLSERYLTWRMLPLFYILRIYCLAQVPSELSVIFSSMRHRTIPRFSLPISSMHFHTQK
ncbi:RNA polymerase recycling motor HelD [Virgibacillus sp. 179-BFC.A HS]|uniref:RNA polymerase recycling motor HelD n=1 Tax=Tigheibacillus jepli TaxID=3035914 RepID=A0ABU5CL65_9BACI|nr:RNA polymerase recycling motor HelD [Virgibacillus sp. 179-BFC.A HS]MDY0407070.1 RNA polymerase recycling motor HelD [Virgibacillus sp. 179-BFC.A HS]